MDREAEQQVAELRADLSPSSSGLLGPCRCGVMALSWPHPGIAQGPPGPVTGFGGPCWARSLTVPLCPFLGPPSLSHLLGSTHVLSCLGLAGLALLAREPSHGALCSGRASPPCLLGTCPPKSHCCPPPGTLGPEEVPESVSRAHQHHLKNGKQAQEESRTARGGMTGGAPVPGWAHAPHPRKAQATNVCPAVALALSQTQCQAAALGKPGHTGGTSGLGDAAAAQPRVGGWLGVSP